MDINAQDARTAHRNHFGLSPDPGAANGWWVCKQGRKDFGPLMDVNGR